MRLHFLFFLFLVLAESVSGQALKLSIKTRPVEYGTGAFFTFGTAKDFVTVTWSDIGTQTRV